MGINKTQYKEECLRLYESYRSDVLNRQNSNAQKYDSALLGLSMASIGLTLPLFTTFLSENKVFEFVWILIGSWSLFCLTIITVILSFLTSNSALLKALKNAEEYYINDKDIKCLQSNVWVTINEIISIFSGLSFISAIIGIIIFTSINYL